jgi:hypothetical protein
MSQRRNKLLKVVNLLDTAAFAGCGKDYRAFAAIVMMIVDDMGKSLEKARIAN